jgi:hypothetical protein
MPCAPKWEEQERDRENEIFESGEVCSTYRTDENMYRNLVRKHEKR